EKGKASFGFALDPSAALEDREIVVRLHFKAENVGNAKVGMDWWMVKNGDQTLDLPFRGSHITIY
ncbi:MAG: hypothetical protein ACREJQ_02790, partial [bacterium]